MKQPNFLPQLRQGFQKGRIVEDACGFQDVGLRSYRRLKCPHRNGWHWVTQLVSENDKRVWLKEGYSQNMEN